MLQIYDQLPLLQNKGRLTKFPLLSVFLSKLSPDWEQRRVTWTCSQGLLCSDLTKEPVVGWVNLTLSPKATCHSQGSLQNSRSKTFTKKQYRGEEEEQQACAFMSIVSSVQECTLLGVLEGSSRDWLYDGVLPQGCGTKWSYVLQLLVLHLLVISSFTHQRFPTCSFTHTLGVLEIFRYQGEKTE